MLGRFTPGTAIDSRIAAYDRDGGRPTNQPAFVMLCTWSVLYQGSVFIHGKLFWKLTDSTIP